MTRRKRTGNATPKVPAKEQDLATKPAWYRVLTEEQRQRALDRVAAECARKDADAQLFERYASALFPIVAQEIDHGYDPAATIPLD
jgi:hypothetical protein